MKKCPNCNCYSYQHDAFTMKYRCYKCNHMETDKEKDLSTKQIENREMVSSKQIDKKK